MSTDLPQFLLDLLACPPSAGDGVHGWLFKVSRQLHAHRSEEDIFCLLKASLEDCGRPVPDREIHDAVKNSKAVAWRPGANGDPGFVAQPAWPPPDKKRIDKLVRGEHGRGAIGGMDGLVDHFDNHRIRDYPELNGGEDSGEFAEVVIDALFPDGPLLCVGEGKGDFSTRAREVWRGELWKCPFIVPNPMDRVWGKTKTGKPSMHTLDATGRRRFLVVEFDFRIKSPNGLKDSEWAPLVRGWNNDGITVADACAELLAHLATLAPLALAVHSGGKSVHGWFYCCDQDETLLRQFMNYAHVLGADDATWCRSQFVRMPDGTRETGERQWVKFFNPDVIA